MFGHLAGRDVAEHARQLFLEVGLRFGEQVAKLLRHFRVAFDPDAPAAQRAFGARSRQRKQRDRRARRGLHPRGPRGSRRD